MYSIENHVWPDIDKFPVRARSLASAIGRKLCDQAIWDGRAGTCHWVGATVLDLNTVPPKSVQRALGGDLYNGSAGIALFLSRLSEVEPDARFVETARGAISHALIWGESAKNYHPLGAHSGTMGLVYVWSRMTNATRAWLARDSASALIEQAKTSLTDPANPVLLDFLSGAAGAISILLAIHRENPNAALLELAKRLGEEICARADWQDEFCTWDPADTSGFKSLPLTGLSHGASGMAFSLLKLFAATGETDFLTTARGAYAYEDTLFEPASKNWLDVRFVDTITDARARHKAIIAWCHGAPGILLSRLTALQIDSDQSERHAEWARIALETTVKALRTVSETSSYDVTPCHGISGLAACVDIAGRVLGEERYCDMARATMMRAMSRHEQSLTFPSGMSDGAYTPSLMLGDAGFGHILLELTGSRDSESILTLS